jgi:hypothetical protein
MGISESQLSVISHAVIGRLTAGRRPATHSALGGRRSRPAVLVKPERDAKTYQQRGAEQEEEDGLLQPGNRRNRKAHCKAEERDLQRKKTDACEERSERKQYQEDKAGRRGRKQFLNTRYQHKRLVRSVGVCDARNGEHQRNYVGKLLPKKMNQARTCLGRFCTIGRLAFNLAHGSPTYDSPLLPVPSAI